MAHIHEKIDFTASVYVVFGDKVLLHKHKKLNIWLPPGGHIELDEDPNQAAVREVQEEAGLDVTLVGNQSGAFASPYGARDLIPPRFLNRHFFDETHTHEHVDHVYFARAADAHVRHEIEGGEIGWFTKEQIETLEDLLPDVRAYALAALHELSSGV